MYLCKWFYGITGAYSNIYVTSKIIHAPIYSGAYVTFKPCPFHPHTDPHSTGLREVAVLCMTVGALKNGIVQIWRRRLITENLRILALFSDLWYSTSKYSKLAFKLNQSFLSRYLYTYPHCQCEALKREISQIRKKCQIYKKNSEVCHFFQICGIPLLRALNCLAMWINLFCQALHRSP